MTTFLWRTRVSEKVGQLKFLLVGCGNLQLVKYATRQALAVVFGTDHLKLAIHAIYSAFFGGTIQRPYEARVFCTYCLWKILLYGRDLLFFFRGRNVRRK